MAITNYQRVGKALELLHAALKPYVASEMGAAYQGQWHDQAKQHLHDWRVNEKGKPDLDLTALFTLMTREWSEVFGKTLGQVERSLVGELREVRNRWAHQEPFSGEDAQRALDSGERLLRAISAVAQADEVAVLRHQLLRTIYSEQARTEVRRKSETLEGQPTGGLRPWREVITPHPDVASGKYQQAEFAADLGQVYRADRDPSYRDRVSSEYRDPQEFFARTYLTEGLARLLTDAALRLSNQGGAPVVELQTNFGGGKTHSMLALFHMFSGVPPTELQGVESLLNKADIHDLPPAKRIVLVGTELQAGQPDKKPDGTLVRTMWGELAWQIGGKEAYEFIREADETATNPGKALRELLEFFSPCLILIDEWVSYARQLYHKTDLPGGSFDTHFTFAQALTEVARSTPGVMVVASIPSSQIEIGGQGGQEALTRLKNVFARMESSWRPATAEESFEIVRRRLFQPITDAHLFTARDAVVGAFADWYRSQAQEFPSECREGSYQRRLTDAYPIHPELFDRLYNDWSSLETFQRTRGVLRLMAAVIHALWERGDAGLLIMPATVPVDGALVQSELRRYLEAPWDPVIEADVDGPDSSPLRLDQENPNLGRYSACRRVARTIFLGSAPTLGSANRGLEDRRVKLGCAQPGESVATFSDALRRLSGPATTYLYADGTRYWYSPVPSVSRLAQDRAAQQYPDSVLEEIRKRLRGEQGQRGDFARVHVCPASAADVPEDREARLVILDPGRPHSAKTEDSPARLESLQMLDQRASGPRMYRNTLVFLAADQTRLTELDLAVREYLAWTSIEAERETLNLDAFQTSQAATNRQQSNETVNQRIPETYQWLLVPAQPSPQGPVEWQEIRLQQGQDQLAVRASKRLKNEELLVTEFAGSRLRLELDRIPLWRGDHVSVRQLAEDFAQYLYLPRFSDANVLVKAIQGGVCLLTWPEDGFGYAEAYDEAQGRYVALSAGLLVNVPADTSGVVVRPEVAARQLEEKTATVAGGKNSAPDKEDLAAGDDSKKMRPRRFHGSVEIDPLRLVRDAGTIAAEVIQHLLVLEGVSVHLTIEITAETPAGAPEETVRTVNENCRTLSFTSHGFEEA